MRQQHDIRRKRHLEQFRFRGRLGIREQERAAAGTLDGERAGTVIFTAVGGRRRMHDAKRNAIPVPPVTARAGLIRCQLAPGLGHGAKDPKGLPEYVDAARVVLIVVADDEEIDPANAPGAQVRHE